MEQPNREFIKSQIEKIKVELEEIKISTAAATAHILDNCDHLSSFAGSEEIATRIYQACATQDLTEQRINKVLRILARIENPELPEDDELLEGPQSGQSGLSQEDTDRLLKTLDDDAS